MNFTGQRLLIFGRYVGCAATSFPISFCSSAKCLDCRQPLLAALPLQRGFYHSAFSL